MKIVKYSCNQVPEDFLIFHVEEEVLSIEIAIASTEEDVDVILSLEDAEDLANELLVQIQEIRNA